MPQRLGIVVPYRDRQQNLDEFLPALLAFLRQSAPDLDCRILLVEQAPGLPFNRGAIKNIGFQYLAPEVDYICFHDVDLVPVTADYSWPEQPTMIAFHGLDFEPSFVRHLFGGAVLLQNAHFAAANGYPNEYWQWGFEDVDLRERLLRCRLSPGHREGTYRKLPHADEGTKPDGTPTDANVENQKRYTNQWFQQLPMGWIRQPNTNGFWRQDGLSSLTFEEQHPRRPLAQTSRAWTSSPSPCPPPGSGANSTGVQVDPHGST